MLQKNYCPEKEAAEVKRMSFRPSIKMNLTEVFADRKGNYINEFMLFVFINDDIPNFIHEVDIDCRKARKWFLKNYEVNENDCYYSKRYFNKNSFSEIDDMFYFLYEDLIINFDTNASTVRFLFRKTALEKVEQLAVEIKKFKEKPQHKIPQIFLLVTTTNGIDTIALDIAKPKLSINDNYNDDFTSIHNTILKRLTTPNDKGLVLLHGKPGTGKTSYIRYLIKSLKKKVIFLPPALATSITSPNLLAILIDNPNSVLVIEDAENIVVDRERNGNSPVSALLNISDGLLADCLNVQIICTFNTDISKIDSALLRKGRLIAKYEFKALEIVKAQALSDKLGFFTAITKPMTLTSIYNQEELEFEETKKNNPIGFQAINGRRLVEN